MESNELGEYIKRKRIQKKLTLGQLSKRIGYSDAYISMVENGKKNNPSYEFLSELAKGLNVNHMKLMYLAGYVKEQEPNFSLIDKSVPSPNSFNIIDDNMATRKKLDFPINDFYFHLTDENNKKMYKNIILDDNDREYVNSMIEIYLLHKYEIKKHDRDNDIKLTDEDFKEIENDIKNKDFKWSLDKEGD